MLISDLVDIHEATQFRQAYVHCIDTGKDAEADIISLTDKKVIVVFHDTLVRLELTRTDTSKPYIGTKANMEFSLLDADID